MNSYEITIISLVILLLLLLVYSIFSSIAINRCTKKIDIYEEWIEKTKERITNAYKKMKEIDTIGAFESDDETGEIFSQIKEIVLDIEQSSQELEIVEYAEEKADIIKSSSV